MPAPMESTARIDEAALGLLYLTLHDRNRAWKGLDFAIFDRLHEAGFIHDPVGKAKSVAFTDEGLKAAEAAWRKLFTSD
jgi:Domain of unknown function (DUF6429)